MKSVKQVNLSRGARWLIFNQSLSASILKVYTRMVLVRHELITKLGLPVTVCFFDKYQNLKCWLIFSSPEPKALGELIV